MTDTDSRPDIKYPCNYADLKATQPLSVPVFASAFWRQWRYYRRTVGLPRKLSFNLSRMSALALARMYWYRGWRNYCDRWQRLMSEAIDRHCSSDETYQTFVGKDGNGAA